MKKEGKKKRVARLLPNLTERQKKYLSDGGKWKDTGYLFGISCKCGWFEAIEQNPLKLSICKIYC